MRDYFLSADGMRDAFKDSEDRNGFSFWPLSRVVRVPEITDVHTLPFDGDSNFFVFADYMHWSWAYAANFTKGSSGAVILIGRAVPEEIAASLEEALGGAGQRIMKDQIKNPLFPKEQFAKMEHIHYLADGTKVVVHYWRDLITGEGFGFKIK